LNKREEGCSFSCTADSRKICASNGKEHKTFSNECVMRVFNCKNPGNGKKFLKSY
jgi:hypothetical protein